MADDSTGQLGDDAAKGVVLRRLLKARNHSRVDAGEAPGMPQNVPMTPARATANAIGRAAEDLYGMPVRALGVTPGGVTLAELPEMLPDPSLLVVVGGPQETLGVVALDPAVVATLIEVQALGRITPRPVEKRRLTRSDALMCAEFVNRLLAELQTELSAMEGFETFRGFSYLSHLDDARPLMLMLEDTVFRSLRMNIAIGPDGAKREARIFIALPQRRPSALLAAPAPRPTIVGGLSPALPQLGAPAAAEAAAPVATDARASLAGAMQDAPVDLIGILCRRQVSLGELRGLRPGKLLALPRVSLYDARIETRQGQVLAHGKLGEADGCHAIRLHDPATLRPEIEARAGGLGSPGLGARPGGGIGGMDLAPSFGAEPLGDLGPAPGMGDLPPLDGLAPFEPPLADLADPDDFRPGEFAPLSAPLAAMGD